MGSNFCRETTGDDESELNKSDEIIDESKWDEEGERLYTLNLKHVKSIKKLIKLIILIQNSYRGYKIRKSIEKDLEEIREHKILLKLSSKRSICYKENWEFYFPLYKNYEFNLQGLNNLANNISHYNIKFFSNEDYINITSNNKNNSATLSTIKDKAALNVIPKEHIYYSPNQIMQIKNQDDFLLLFKNYFYYRMTSLMELPPPIVSVKYSKLYFELQSMNNDINIIKEIDLTKLKMENKTINSKYFPDKEPYLFSIKELLDNEKEKGCFITAITLPNGAYYFGPVMEENNNIRCGLGKEYYIDNIKDKPRYKYCGYYKNDLYEPIGIYIDEKNNAYFGEYKKGNKDGYGTEYSNSFTYEGFFKDNLKEGYGKLTTLQFKYIGDFHLDLFDGFGFLEEINKSFYVGSFDKGKFNGIGYYKWDDGMYYYGSWLDGKMEGLGEYHYSSGDVYIGNYKNDLRDGEGTYYYRNGNVLKGKWEKGLKQGDFMMTVKNDNKKKKHSTSIFDFDDSESENIGHSYNENFKRFSNLNSQQMISHLFEEKEKTYSLKFKDDIQLEVFEF